MLSTPAVSSHPAQREPVRELFPILSLPASGFGPLFAVSGNGRSVPFLYPGVCR